MSNQTDKPENGQKRTIDGKDCIYYDGYWIRRYEVVEDTLANKKRLIDQLTKRVFHHIETGLNTPGFRLNEIKKTYEDEENVARKRVKGGMLAGALLNRGTDILTSIVDLEAAGVHIEPGNELMKQCGQCFVEALALGKHIKLSSGGEGIDEIWGEPFKVLHMSMEDYYQSRYIKVAQTMSQIDKLSDLLKKIAQCKPVFSEATVLIEDLCESAKIACETLRSDPASFEIWPRHVVAKEHYEDYIYALYENFGEGSSHGIVKGINLLMEGGQIVVNLSTVRVPMPESMKKFISRCNVYLKDKENQKVLNQQSSE